MTDDRLPDDELVSAYLDGEVGDDERRRVESDPVLRARARELRAAAEAVASPVTTLDEVTARRLVDAALAAAAGEPPVGAAPTASRRRRPLAWAGAAAAVVVGLVLVSVLPDGGTGGDLALTDRADDEVTTLDAEPEVGAAPEALDGGADAAGDDAADATEAAPDMATDEAADDAGAAGVGDGSDASVEEDAAEEEGDGGAPAEAAPLDLGDQPDVDALADAARAVAVEGSAPVSTPALCDWPDAAGTLVLEARATVGAEEYVVAVWSDAAGALRVDVVPADTCPPPAAP